MKNHTISVTEFKAKCLDIERRVHDEEVSYTITKRDEIVAILQPVEKAQGHENPLKGSVVNEGDLISPKPPAR
ncbi:type II toxin-antitoxin system Phd/YefM family antitoxin [Natronogracilivirga saccharolytica]|uniref:Antitoxin n=1 Tax=Natronogracilivirga saccharolytica TaxID=2812953 RepID=A0A8J7RMA0_9BACT|nr:hypothetical protein [Natronogracilivirga saccharolytica]MBP3193530.1 hypothetical protein [Natronogracilivirga saccharolytica]